METTLLEVPKQIHLPREGDRKSEPSVMEVDGLQRLIGLLRENGYQVLGPIVRDGAIVYDEIQSVDQLPVGYTEVQERATYQLKRRADRALFGYTVGPFNWKRYLFPPSHKLWSADRTESGSFTITPNTEPAPKQAFLGVRGCDLAAIEQLDRVFLHGPYTDPAYAERRRNTFIVGVNCTQCAATCFCTSLGSGPAVHGSIDLALTEILETTRHAFLIESGSREGAALLEQLPVQRASDAEVEAARGLVRRTAESMRRHLDTSDVHDLLLDNVDHPYWENLAARCMACGNCTMVCPSCFCSTVEDVTDLTGQHTERIQVWDSCFTSGHSYVVGGSVHASIRSRYRQWLTHKLSTWTDQFGSEGCVGCGRCITWCPAGIDLTEEVETMRNAVSRQNGNS